MRQAKWLVHNDHWKAQHESQNLIAIGTQRGAVLVSAVSRSSKECLGCRSKAFLSRGMEPTGNQRGITGTFEGGIYWRVSRYVRSTPTVLQCLRLTTRSIETECGRVLISTVEFRKEGDPRWSAMTQHRRRTPPLRVFYGLGPVPG